ncbi:MAG: adenosylcobinamide-GDP ribazoletransferase [Methyloceanibacter sp.]|uniref:adenosylcobinamide-GDP ribazoletransferase n=1 Tax=Methyloceanibacter sp. TaxID=1965321 RepID=UPI003D6D66FA
MGGITTDIRTGLAFCTRLPLGRAAAPEGASLARASWTFPLIGALVGAIGAAVCWLADTVGLDPFVSATLAVAATLLVTGCLHEDGLADTADGFGGGATKDRKLEIMRDSRSGAYGVAALVLSVLLRVAAIASLADPVLVAAALIAAHAAARATMPLFMLLVPAARRDGLSAGAGRPPLGSAIAAGVLGLLALLLCLGVAAALMAAMLVAAAVALMAWISLRQIGGQTGDVLGAVEQISEMLILLTASALL